MGCGGGGIVVNPGDIVVADAAGIVVVPREIAEELLERLQAQVGTARYHSPATPPVAADLQSAGTPAETPVLSS